MQKPWLKQTADNYLAVSAQKLNYLVVGEDAGSKLDKAKKLNTVKIISEDEFLKLIRKK